MFFQCTFVRSSASSQFSHSCFILFVLIFFTSVIIHASSDACYFYRSSHPLPLRPFTAIGPPLIRGLNLAPLRCPHRRSEAALDTETTTLKRVETGEETKVTVMSSPQHTRMQNHARITHTGRTRDRAVHRSKAASSPRPLVIETRARGVRRARWATGCARANARAHEPRHRCRDGESRSTYAIYIVSV